MSATTSATHLAFSGPLREIEQTTVDRQKFMVIQQRK